MRLGRRSPDSSSFSNMSPKGSCRFNYPKPPSPHTIISDEPQENCQQQIDFAVKNLTAVKQVLESKDLSTDIYTTGLHKITIN